MNVDRRQDEHWQEHCQQNPRSNMSLPIHVHGRKGTNKYYMLYLFNVIFLESYPQLAGELAVQLIPAGDGGTEEVVCVAV